MALSEEQIQEFEQKHGKVAHCKAKSGAWEAVFRKPTRPEYKRWRSQTANEATRADAQEILLTSCVVYPERVAFQALLDQYPAIPETCGTAVGKLLDCEVEESEKV
jgi:hypothetical protein